MPTVRITKKAVDEITPTGAEFTVWDRDLTGFGVRVRPNGAMSFVVVYRAGNGRKAAVKKLTVGAVGRLTPDEARGLAKKALGAVANGHDPAADKSDASKGLTVRELADVFLSDHVRAKRKNATIERYEHSLRAHIVPEFGSTKVDKLTRSAVSKLHLKLKATPAMANYSLAVISSMYGFAQRRGLAPEGMNPASRIEKYKERQRERFLTVEELAIGRPPSKAERNGIPWEVDEARPTAKHAPKIEDRRTVFGPFAVAAVRLLLLTGCRLREVLQLKWSYIDFDRGMIFSRILSRTETRGLNAPALAVLASVPNMGSYVVPGDDPEKPRHDLKKIWAAACRRAGLGSVRLHDLRHTFASVGAGGGLGLPIVGRLLGHTQAATTARYAHLDADPLRRASDRIGGAISAALDANRSAEIINLSEVVSERRGRR